VNNKYISAAELSRLLWESLDINIKSLKAGYNNPLHKSGEMWRHIDERILDLKNLKRFVPGMWYLRGDDDDYMVFRFNGYVIPEDEDSVKAQISVFTSTKADDFYEGNKSEMEIALGRLRCYDVKETTAPTPKECLIWVGNKFKGALMLEMLKNGGTEEPATPEVPGKEP
jgi:hypothetical protein